MIQAHAPPRPPPVHALRGGVAAAVHRADRLRLHAGGDAARTGLARHLVLPARDAAARLGLAGRLALRAGLRPRAVDALARLAPGAATPAGHASRRRLAVDGD